MIAQLNHRYIRTRPRKAFTRLLSYAFFEGRPLTTKARWINPLVFTLFRLEKRLPPLRKVDRPIFIVGTGRSGTTMTGMTLSLHHDVGFLNEPKALWHSIYEHEDVVGSYSRDKAFFRLSEKDVTDNVCRNAHRLYSAYLTFTQSKRVLDKYPEMVFRISFLKKIFPDAKFILMARNGWDVCRSIKTWSMKKGGRHKKEIHDWWGVNQKKWNLLISELLENDSAYSASLGTIKRFRSHIYMALIEWIATMREGLQQLQLYHENMYFLRYEDLIRNPEIELNKLLEFCELEKDKKLQQYLKSIVYYHNPHKPFQIPMEIEPLFLDTMARLGYANV